MDNDQIKETVLQITKNLDQRIDELIDLMDNMNINDLEQPRKQGLQELQQQNKELCSQNGHGFYDELAEEEMFFDAIKKSKNVIVHFFTPNNARCLIFDEHLKILARKHLETRIVSLNAEKCPVLAKHLGIKVIPLLVSFQNGVVVDRIVDFADDFSTEDLEWRLGHSEVIDYDADLLVLPKIAWKTKKTTKKTVSDGFSGN